MNTGIEASRPRDVAAMRACLSRFATEAGVARGLAYRPDPSDVFISPYGKCGTTWMQQIVHGLRTGGSMDFDEITRVVPWLEMAHDLGLDLKARQAAWPRAFKSHLSWDEIPKGGRYIVVMRDPVDAMVSLYNFFDGWFFESGAISIEDFAGYYLERDSADNYFAHARSWWAQRARPDVLLLSYEAMKADLPGTVERVADFIDPTIGRPARDVALAQAGFDFMKRHDRQFNDHLVRAARDGACGLPPGGDSTKVRTGAAGAGRSVVNAAIRAEFDTAWRETFGAEGPASYAELAGLLQRR